MSLNENHYWPENSAFARAASAPDKALLFSSLQNSSTPSLTGFWSTSRLQRAILDKLSGVSSALQ